MPEPGAKRCRLKTDPLYDIDRMRQKRLFYASLLNRFCEPLQDGEDAAASNRRQRPVIFTRTASTPAAYQILSTENLPQAISSAARVESQGISARHFDTTINEKLGCVLLAEQAVEL